MRKDKSERFADFCRKASKEYGHPRISKEQAKASGLMFFFGSPCIEGHEGFRYVSNGMCRVCRMNTNAALNNGITVAEVKSASAKKKSRDDLLFDLEMKRLNAY